jgi:hypothetical protein
MPDSEKQPPSTIAILISFILVWSLPSIVYVMRNSASAQTYPTLFNITFYVMLAFSVTYTIVSLFVLGRRFTLENNTWVTASLIVGSVGLAGHLLFLFL